MNAIVAGLQRKGLLDEQAAERVDSLLIEGTPLDEALLSASAMPEDQLLRSIAEECGVPYAELETCQPERQFLERFPARILLTHRLLPLWEKEGVEMASHAAKALGVNSFWDLDVAFIEYDLDLATKRWDEVNKKYESEIFRKWGELKNSLFLIEEVEGEIQAAKGMKIKTKKAEQKIKEARKLFEVDGNYAGARLAASQARAALVK